MQAPPAQFATKNGLLRTELDGAPSWEVGYILLGRFCGCGYATEGAQAMIEYAFTACGAERVLCDIRPMNTASLAVARRLGMTEIGSIVKHYRGKEMPHLLFERKRR